MVLTSEAAWSVSYSIKATPLSCTCLISLKSGYLPKILCNFAESQSYGRFETNKSLLIEFYPTFEGFYYINGGGILYKSLIFATGYI